MNLKVFHFHNVLGSEFGKFMYSSLFNKKNMWVHVRNVQIMEAGPYYAGKQ
jgi:hypothetical protein